MLYQTAGTALCIDCPLWDHSPVTLLDMKGALVTNIFGTTTEGDTTDPSMAGF